MAKNTKSILILLVLIIPGSNTITQAVETDYEIVDPNEVPSILSILASATKTNYEKIHTWQGQITSKRIITIRGEKAKQLLRKNTDANTNNLPSKIQVIHNNRIEYKIDMANNHFFSLSDRTEPPAYLDPENGKVYPLQWGPGESIQIVTPEYQTEIDPASWRKKDKTITSRIATKKSSYRPANRIDPREEFYIGNKTLWLSLSQLVQAGQISGIPHYGIVIKKKISDDNTIYLMEISEPGKDYPFQVLVFSGEAGFNRTYIENWSNADSLMSKTTTKFVEHQGVFVPEKWEMLQYFPDGELMRQEDCMIEHQQINEPMPENTFSVQNYMSNGDKLKDNIAGKEFKYKNGELIEIVETSAED